MNIFKKVPRMFPCNAENYREEIFLKMLIKIGPPKIALISSIKGTIETISRIAFPRLSKTGKEEREGLPLRFQTSFVAVFSDRLLPVARYNASRVPPRKMSTAVSFSDWKTTNCFLPTMDLRDKIETRTGVRNRPNLRSGRV